MSSYAGKLRERNICEARLVCEHASGLNITFYDYHLMQEKQEREAAAAEEGWTVVVSKTGRKKTTDDTGIAVGAVSAAAVMERAKKKQKTDISVDFYRFQKREARRNGKPDVLWFELYL